MSNSYFKAPQKALSTTWANEEKWTKRSKPLTVIKMSRGRNKQAIGKIDGVLVPLNISKDSYQY